MEFNELEKVRLEKINRLKEQNIQPYPNRAEITATIREACESFEKSETSGTAEPLVFTLAGRMRSMRVMGKLAFTHIEDGSGKIQLFLRINELGDQLDFFKEYFDLGDFIEATGTMMRTRSGEISLLVTSLRMLAKAISPLPAAKEEVVDGVTVRHTGLSDPEIRYRQRYADLVVNPDVRQIFRTRAKIISSLRTFLDSHDFLEVETPILQPIYGGAAARPFTTHHNQLHQDLFLRISFELYLKRLLVGGFDRVYEIGRDFRNEGVSYKHNPEFTQLEFYCAYFDYFKVMDFTEEMLRFTAQNVLGTTKFSYNGHAIDLSQPWHRVNMREQIIIETGIDFKDYPDTESLRAAMEAKGIKSKPGVSRGKLINQLVEEYLEPNFLEPTFLYDYPWEISPLAKRKADDPTITERFEGFIAGMELLNAFTELNDPIDQEIRFLEMGRAYTEEDEEHNPIDEDYLRAMRYGMPPNGGFGMGIDRLTMLFTDKHTIREVLLFPHLRERDKDGNETEA
ncbi:MAG: lysine--tRNA ligase [Chloroflexi bacterium]|nr:lysine--tRNA ligase [Chloroflexota bacterium]